MNPKYFSDTAAESLKKAAFDPKRLALIHSGIALLVSLLVTLINFLTTKNMDAATGLAQMGNRAIWGTVQTVLSMACNIALPFWEVGFLYATLRNLRSADARPADLTEGFHRFAKVARLYILLFLLYFLLFFLSMQVSSVLISFTPYWESIMTKSQALTDSALAAGKTTIETEDMMALLPSMIPLFILMGALLLSFGIPLFYRYRMVFFALMDDAPGARAAMKLSGRIMQNHKRKLFKLDLHFWWYYAAQLLCIILAYGDMILPAIGIDLPLSADGLFFLTYGIYIVLQTLLAWRFASHIQTAYAVFYDMRKAETAPVEDPQLPEA